MPELCATMTLDMAKERANRIGSKPTYADLLSVATIYWHDGMIMDETYAEIVLRVATWLRGEKHVALGDGYAFM